MNIKVVAVLAFIACLVLVDARGGRRRGRQWRNNANTNAVSTYRWSRGIEGGQTVQELAWVNQEFKKITIRSIDAALNGTAITPATTVYFFPEGQEPLMVIQTIGNRRGRPCFLADTGLTFDGMVSVLGERNVSTSDIVSTIDVDEIDGTLPPLSREQVTELQGNYQGIRRLCRRNIFDDRASAPDVTAEDGDDVADTRIIKVLTFDSTVEITFPNVGSGGRRGHGSGRGRGRGEGRGQGRRQGRGQGRRQGRGGRRNNRSRGGSRPSSERRS